MQSLDYRRVDVGNDDGDLAAVVHFAEQRGEELALRGDHDPVAAEQLRVLRRHDLHVGQLGG